MLYLIEDNEYSRAIGKYIDVWHYPDGHKELRLNGVLLPYSTYDRLSEVDPVAIVDNKRLGHVLDVARQVQRKRDNNRSQSLPCSGDEPSRRRHAPSINKSQRSLNEAPASSFTELPPVSWTSKLKSREWEAFHVCGSEVEA